MTTDDNSFEEYIGTKTVKARQVTKRKVIYVEDMDNYIVLEPGDWEVRGEDDVIYGRKDKAFRAQYKKKR